MNELSNYHKCNKCRKLQLKENFYRVKDKIENICIDCRREYKKKITKKNKPVELITYKKHLPCKLCGTKIYCKNNTRELCKYCQKSQGLRNLNIQIQKENKELKETKANKMFKFFIVNLEKKILEYNHKQISYFILNKNIISENGIVRLIKLKRKSMRKLYTDFN